MTVETHTITITITQYNVHFLSAPVDHCDSRWIGEASVQVSVQRKLATTTRSLSAPMDASASGNKCGGGLQRRSLRAQASAARSKRGAAAG